MRVDGLAMPVPVDLSRGHSGWPEPRYHLPLRAPSEEGVQAKKGPDTVPFLGWTRRKSWLWVPGAPASGASHGFSLTVRGRKGLGSGGLAS